MSPKLLPLMDSELTAMIRRQLETKGMEILTESKVVSVENCGAGGRVHIECPERREDSGGRKDTALRWP